MLMNGNRRFHRSAAVRLDYGFKMQDSCTDILTTILAKESLADSSTSPTRITGFSNLTTLSSGT